MHERSAKLKMSNHDIRALIEQGKAVLGIEMGSTRIKAVLSDENGQILALGGQSWENSLVNGVWTYGLDEVWSGLRSAYASLRQEVEQRYSVTLRRLSAIGISGMMHGYLAFDASGELLAPSAPGAIP